MLFELEQAPDLRTIPETGGDTVVAYNLESGERIPIHVNISEYARSRHVSSPSQIIEIYPRSRWDFGKKYVVAITDTLRTEQGKKFQPSDGFLRSAASDGSPLSNYYEPAFNFLDSQGHSRNTLNAITFFTVRSENEVTGPMKILSDYVYEENHPIKNLNVRYPWFGWVGLEQPSQEKFMFTILEIAMAAWSLISLKQKATGFSFT